MRTHALTSLVLALTACADSGPVTIETAEFAPQLNVDLTKSTRTAHGAYYRDLVVGTGAQVAVNQVLKVHYVGSLRDNTTFDKNTGTDAPYSFQLGVGSVIQGWDEGLPGATVGSTRQLIIPPDLGYGPYQQGLIPANSILVFTVEILSAQAP